MGFLLWSLTGRHTISILFLCTFVVLIACNFLCFCIFILIANSHFSSFFKPQTVFSLKLNHTTNTLCIYNPFFHMCIYCHPKKRGRVRLNPEHFVIVWDELTFHHLFQSHSGLQPVQRWCHLSFHLTLHSSTPQRKSFPHGGGKLITTSQMIRCPYWIQWMLDVWTYLQKLARDASDMVRKKILSQVCCKRGQKVFMRTYFLNKYSFVLHFWKKKKEKQNKPIEA